jgi:predicted MFS family arabinose efflux permease
MSCAVSALEPPPFAGAWRATLSGLCASLVGHGLARFAYTPLLPAIVTAQWFGASQAAYLGAANLAGYLAGALLAGRLSARLGVRTVLRGMMVATTLSLLACAWPVDFAWFFVWRLVSGIGGGALMVLTAAAVLPQVPPAHRGAASGVIFTGIGLGIAASGTLVPLLLRRGLTPTWLALGALALALTLVAWHGWPDTSLTPPPVRHAAVAASTARLRALYAAHSLNAVGLVPHMIFLVDYVARGLGQGLAAGTRYWVVFGLGAMVGPLLGGRVADRTGFGIALRLGYVLQAVAVAIAALGAFGSAGLLFSSAVCGAFTPGIVPLVLGRVREMLPGQPALHHEAWSRATTGFAVMQAVAAYGFSYLLTASAGDYALLFALAAGAMVLALCFELASSVTAPAASAVGR